VAAEILASYDFVRHRHLIDIGGSNGTFLQGRRGALPAAEAAACSIFPKVAETRPRKPRVIASRSMAAASSTTNFPKGPGRGPP